MQQSPLSPVTFPAKSEAGYADAQLTWEHGAVSTGWFWQDGWGGRRTGIDVARMGNGNLASTSGMRAPVRMAVGAAGQDAYSRLTLEARKGSRAVCLGRRTGGAMRHASADGLTFNSRF